MAFFLIVYFIITKITSPLKKLRFIIRGKLGLLENVELNKTSHHIQTQPEENLTLNRTVERLYPYPTYDPFLDFAKKHPKTAQLIAARGSNPSQGSAPPAVELDLEKRKARFEKNANRYENHVPSSSRYENEAGNHPMITIKYPQLD